MSSLVYLFWSGLVNSSLVLQATSELVNISSPGAWLSLAHRIVLMKFCQNYDYVHQFDIPRNDEVLGRDPTELGRADNLTVKYYTSHFITPAIDREIRSVRKMHPEPERASLSPLTQYRV